MDNAISRTLAGSRGSSIVVCARSRNLTQSFKSRNKEQGRTILANPNPVWSKTVNFYPISTKNGTHLDLGIKRVCEISDRCESLGPGN